MGKEENSSRVNSFGMTELVIASQGPESTPVTAELWLSLYLSKVNCFETQTTCSLIHL